MIDFPHVCMDCDNDDPNAFTWDYAKITRIPAGGLSELHDVGVNVFLGCDLCSSTLVVMPLDDFLAYATQAFNDVIRFANAVDCSPGREHPWIPGVRFIQMPKLVEAMDRWRGRLS